MLKNQNSLEKHFRPENKGPEVPAAKGRAGSGEPEPDPGRAKGRRGAEGGAGHGQGPDLGERHRAGAELPVAMARRRKTMAPGELRQVVNSSKNYCFQMVNSK